MKAKDKQSTLIEQELIEKLMKNAKSTEQITPDNVHQIGNTVNRNLISDMIRSILLPGSCILGFPNLKELVDKSKAGEACLLLVEHYSNFDIPAIYELLDQAGEAGKEVAESLISIAGMKLTVENPVVRAFSEAYTRIVIYPSRSLKQYENTDQFEEEKKLSNNINRAALHNMIRAKHHGHIILVFPSGTRYREGDPSTKKGLPEIDSYLKSFDNVVFLGVAGSLLRVTDVMERDEVTPDAVILSASEVMSAKQFRQEARELGAKKGIADLKQFAADAVMQKLDEMHNIAQSERQKALAKLKA
ncbi:MAG: 1-acyl-sn-glycerol-3-phosphate acyltransferase [Spirochaetaceae bacterium]|nr:MAG: 1-acyl-sn-glycerol-3-phosphate acyltransferase [Spirochaetaceae bacterium]